MGYRGAPNAFVGPQYQERLKQRLADRLGCAAVEHRDGVFSRITGRIAEAQRVLELSIKEGYFDDVGAADVQNVHLANKTFQERLRQAALDMLADQYPELDVEVRFRADDRFTPKGLSRSGMTFRVFNKGTL